MYSYGYFTSPTTNTPHEFCKKCTSSYGCVCDLLIQHGHCPTCMNPPHKCLCKERSIPAPTTTVNLSWTAPVVKDSSKWIMNHFWKDVVKDHDKLIVNHFWKEACKVENVPFTRKEHCAYPRVLATYHRLRKEYNERDEKLMKERSSEW